jgi:FkbM family methyltransferase
MVVIDVGANIGMYTMLSARAVASDGKVFAFEPVPHVYDRLNANLMFSGIVNVTAHCIAISDTSGTASFYLGKNDSMGSLCRAQTSVAIEVATATLDGFLEGNGVTRVDAVKLDAEGAEMRILRGMSRLLSRPDRPILFVEHNDTALRAAGSSAEELFGAIVDYGYAPYLVEQGALRPVDVFPGFFLTSEEPYANCAFLPRDRPA